MSNRNFTRKPISSLTPLSGILASTTKNFSQRDCLWKELIVKLWPQVVGKGFSEQITVEKLQKGVLFLSVAEDSWIKPFQERTRIIINKINYLLKEEVVKKIIINGPGQPFLHL